MPIIENEYTEKKIPLFKNLNWNKIKNIKIEDNGEELVSTSLIPEKIVVRPYYFIQNIEGALPECYLRNKVFEKLIKAHEKLPEGYKFVIFDAWRPIKVQKRLYKMIKEKLTKNYPSKNKEKIKKMATNYVALPSSKKESPSPHTTGGAVDLSIVNEKGRLLKMGTEFDTANKKSNINYYEEKYENNKKLTKEEKNILKNRRLLYNIMTSVGFTNFPKEWWHYDYGNQNWVYFTEKNNLNAIYGKTEPDFIWDNGPPLK